MVEPRALLEREFWQCSANDGRRINGSSSVSGKTVTCLVSLRVDVVRSTAAWMGYRRAKIVAGSVELVRRYISGQ